MVNYNPLTARTPQLIIKFNKKANLGLIPSDGRRCKRSMNIHDLVLYVVAILTIIGIADLGANE